MAYVREKASTNIVRWVSILAAMPKTIQKSSANNSKLEEIKNFFFFPLQSLIKKEKELLLFKKGLSQNYKLLVIASMYWYRNAHKKRWWHCFSEKSQRQTLTADTIQRKMENRRKLSANKTVTWVCYKDI